MAGVHSMKRLASTVLVFAALVLGSPLSAAAQAQPLPSGAVVAGDCRPSTGSTANCVSFAEFPQWVLPGLSSGLSLM